MNHLRKKLAFSIILLVGICIVSPMVGITVATVDEREGVMIDFGYYNVDWIELNFDENMNGIEALEKACSLRGYNILKDMYGSIVSVNGEANLVASVWGMYVLEANKTWSKVDTPKSYIICNEKIISWARASDVNDMMPAVDHTGHTYYSYAHDGKTIHERDLRIASLAPSVTETLAAVGASENIVATDKFSNYPQSVYDRQNSGEISFVGGYTDPNYELILSSDPDIVFLDGSIGEHVSIADKLRKSGLNAVVFYEVVKIQDLMKNIWIAASAIGMSERGNDYNVQLSMTMNSISAVSDIKSLKAFISLSTHDSPFVAGNNTYPDSILTSIGVTNVFSDIPQWGMVDREAIYVKQPDAIIIIYSGSEITSDREYEKVLRSLNSMWKDTPAFERKNIYIFSGESADLLSRPGARLGAVTELIAKVLDRDSFIAADYWDRCPKYFGDDYSQYLKYQGTEGVLLV